MRQRFGITSLSRLLFILMLCGPIPGQTYKVQTVAGGGAGLPPFVDNRLNRWDIACAAINAQGDIFMTVANYNIVVRRDSRGGLARIAGNYTAGYSGDGGSATSASFNGPAGIAVASDGSLYIVDAFNSRIRKVTDGIITTIAGNGSQGFGGDGGPATSAALYLPTFVALDSADNLYIADLGNARVRKVSNGIITTVAGNGIRGYLGDGGPATSAELIAPTGIAVDSGGALYIADYASHTVRTVSNGVIATVAGNGIGGYNGDDRPAASAEFSGPLGLTVSKAGELYIADSGNNRIRKITNGIVTTVLSDYPPFAPNSSDILRSPSSVAVDDEGTIYIADEDHGRVLTLKSEVVTTVVGQGMPSFGGDGGPALNALMNRPAGVAVDNEGAVYFSDTGNARVRKISNGIITTVAGGGSMRGENIPATNADLGRQDSVCVDRRTGVAVDAAKNIYISSGCTNRVYKVSNGIISTVAGPDGLLGPRDIAVDSAGVLYIADTGNYRILKVTNGIVTTVAGDGTMRPGDDNVPIAGAPLGGWPNAVTVDALGNLYIAQGGDQRIRKVSNGIITTISRGGGEHNGITVDSAGNIYVSENGKIDKVIDGDLVTIMSGTVGGLNDDDSPASRGWNFYPMGLAVNSSGSIYVADLANDRIRVLIPQSAGGTVDVAVPSTLP